MPPRTPVPPARSTPQLRHHDQRGASRAPPRDLRAEPLYSREREGGTPLPPALVASQPQGLALNFSVSPTAVFGIGQTSGVLFLQPGASLSFITQSIFALTVTAVSSAGTQASASVAVLVTQVRTPGQQLCDVCLHPHLLHGTGE